MKRIIIIILCAALLLVSPLTAYASNSVAITVVIPQAELPEEPPAPPPPPPRNYLYPVRVSENVVNGRREVIRLYELTARQRSENISREPFVRDGWLFELAHITRQETSSTDTREHRESVRLDTATNDIASILTLLAPTMDYRANDGYSGVLSLDISTIRVEVAGTRAVSSTISATREYPHLSSNDPSLIPQTITENGRTLTLSNIQWRVQDTMTIDFFPVTLSYTAVATYTGTTSRNVVTGYITTAEYRGTLSRVTPGRTVYTAHFQGIPIVAPIINEVADEPVEVEPQVVEEPQEIEKLPPIEELPAQPTTEPPIEIEISINIELPTEVIPEIAAEYPQEYEAEAVIEIEVEAEKDEQANNFVPFILAVLAGIAVGGGVVVLYQKNNIKKERITHENEAETD